MRLSDLLSYDDFTVQSHDNPDPDALASGYGVYTYLKNAGKKVRFIYSGMFEIQKSNLLLMKEMLEIPIEYEAKPAHCNFLITVDCQCGQRNVTTPTADHVATIDHHQISGTLPDLADVRSNLGSCSTIIWDLLKKEDFPIEENEQLATAMYYGLYTDTNGFAELVHPMDKDLRDEAKWNRNILRILLNSNLSLDEMSIAGDALLHHEFFSDYKYAILKADPCDPNILGVISDMVLSVDKVEVCLVYSVLPFGIKLSIRSCVPTTKASDLAAYLCKGVGNGGGHLDKAGGFIQLDLIGDQTPETFVKSRMKSYFENSEVIYAATYEADIASMKEYEKLPIKLGYVKATDVASVGTKICIRTLEGDFEVEVADDLYIIIGIKGEIYPNRGEKFHRSYKMVDDPYVFTGEYAPTIKDVYEGKSLDLIQYAKTCVSMGTTHIFSKPIERITKIFTAWDQEKYMLGNPGDYIAVRTDDYHDAYIIEKNIFGMTYKEV